MVRAVLFFLTCFAILSASLSYAQGTLPLYPSLTSQYTGLFTSRNDFFPGKSHLQLLNQHSFRHPIDEPLIIESSIHSIAFFCRMEDKLHERLNIWIKIRTGDDDSYRKMIAIR